VRAVAALALVLATSATADANVGKPSRGGTYAGELDGIGAITIAHEDLVIDLRPLAQDGLVAVSATYHLDNGADAKHLDLVFASGSEAAEFHVALDGHEVPYAAAAHLTLPASWRVPTSTPLFAGGELGYDLGAGPMPIGFQLDVPPGRHDLAISYRADAILYHFGDPTVLRQFAYVLAPAGTWGGFGGLDVTVHVPAGWRVAITPVLARDGDTLHAKFASVPADAIALTVQAPLGAYTIVAYATRALFALVVLAGGFVVAWRTRKREQQRETIGGSNLAAFRRALVWALAVLATGLLAAFGPDGVLPAGQGDRRGYGEAFATIGVVLVTLVTIVIGTVIAVVVRARVRRSYSQ
jgi:hypothetical protein